MAVVAAKSSVASYQLPSDATELPLTYGKISSWGSAAGLSSRLPTELLAGSNGAETEGSLAA